MMYGFTCTVNITSIVGGSRVRLLGVVVELISVAEC
jgi:hypothetical protein